MKLRIIAGDLGGRQLEAPRSHKTHPMSEKIRGALFNMLGDVKSLTLLDAFAGSGAVAFEAISRGARHVTAVEVDKDVHALATRNAMLLGVAAVVKIIRANVSSWSDNNLETRFDIVFCDPPYDSVKPALLGKLAKHVANDGLLVCSLPPDLQLMDVDGFSLVVKKSYGDATLVFYKKTG